GGGMGGRNELRKSGRRRRAGLWLGIVLAFGPGFGPGFGPAAARAEELRPPARPAPPAAAKPADPVAAAALFAMPEVTAETRAALGSVPEGDLAAAAAALDGLVARHPEVGAVYANRAGLAMLQGDRAGALMLLEAAGA